MINILIQIFDFLTNNKKIRHLRQSGRDLSSDRSLLSQSASVAVVVVGSERRRCCCQTSVLTSRNMSAATSPPGTFSPSPPAAGPRSLRESSRPERTFRPASQSSPGEQSYTVRFCSKPKIICNSQASSLPDVPAGVEGDPGQFPALCRFAQPLPRFASHPRGV